MKAGGQVSEVVVGEWRTRRRYRDGQPSRRIKTMEYTQAQPGQYGERGKAGEEEQSNMGVGSTDGGNERVR